MRRVGGESSGFLSLEVPIQPMNTMVLALLRPANAAGESRPVTLDYLRRHIGDRLDELPAFRWRVVRVPLGLHHPVFIEDPDFDLSFHIREFALRAPGRDDQLDRFCAGLAEHALDRRHPLWQLTMVNGLHGGGQAMVLRVHHCLMDGFATVTALSRIFSRDEREVATVAAPWRPERIPSPSHLLLDSLRDQGRAARYLPALIKKTSRNFAAAKAAQSASIVVPRSGVDAPPSLINRAFTADRRYARAALPIADVKLVKNVAGVSVNDVALAIVAGALRAYLEARGALPAKPLVAMVPVGLEAPGAATRTFGNRFANLATSLATDTIDPWERLKVITEVAAEAKRVLTVFGPELLPDWLEYLPPAIVDRVVRRDLRQRRAPPHRIDVNVVISNVRGPAAPWSLGSVVVDDMYLSGPPNRGAGVNVVLWDYGDRLLFGILAFADSVEAPGELAAGLHRCLAELVQIATTRVADGSGGGCRPES